MQPQPIMPQCQSHEHYVMHELMFSSLAAEAWAQMMLGQKQTGQLTRWTRARTLVSGSEACGSVRWACAGWLTGRPSSEGCQSPAGRRTNRSSAQTEHYKCGRVNSAVSSTALLAEHLCAAVSNRMMMMVMMKRLIPLTPAFCDPLTQTLPGHLTQC